MQHLLLQVQYIGFHFYHMQLMIVRIESIKTWSTFFKFDNNIFQKSLNF